MEPSLRPNAFLLLGVTSDASDEEVKTAYKKTALVQHPDKGGDAEVMQQLTEAKHDLLSPGGRQRELERTRPVATRSRVRLIGLTNKIFLNGQQGTVGKWNGLRLQVHLPLGTKAVRPENVLVLPIYIPSACGAWATAGASAMGGSSWASAHTVDAERFTWASVSAATTGEYSWASAGTSSTGASSWGSPSPHAAAAAAQDVSEQRGLVACCGSFGQECPNWAWLRRGKSQCRACCTATQNSASASAAPRSAPPTAFSADSDDCAKNIYAARELAQILADRHERGFEMMRTFATIVERSRDCQPSIFEETLYRLALIGDSDIIPKTMRKSASHCGGVPPKEPVLPGFTESPLVADPSNAVYAKIVRRLFKLVQLSTATGQQAAQVEHIKAFNDEHLADLIEAALAAADMAAAFETSTPRSWATLIGGAHGSGDAVTEWLVSAVFWDIFPGQDKP